MSFLTPKEKARAATVKAALAKGINPYEHISGRIVEDKPYKTTPDTRLAISPGRTYFPKPSNKRRQRPGCNLTQQSPVSTTGIVCIVCGKDTTYSTSVKGKRIVGSGVKQGVNVELIGTELVEIDNSKVFPIFKSGRACLECRDRLTVVQEDEKVD